MVRIYDSTWSLPWYSTILLSATTSVSTHRSLLTERRDTLLAAAWFCSHLSLRCCCCLKKLWVSARVKSNAVLKIFSSLNQYGCKTYRMILAGSDFSGCNLPDPLQRQLQRHTRLPRVLSSETLNFLRRIKHTPKSHSIQTQGINIVRQSQAKKKFELGMPFSRSFSPVVWI